MQTRSAIVLSRSPIEARCTEFDTEEGAEVRFLGIVRAEEAGRTLRGIDYSAFESMAKKTLLELIDAGAREHGAHQVYIQHRLGFVAVGEPSIAIHVVTRHSAAAFELCHWYLSKIKVSVPIWKQPVPV